jgi:hypothetical protein
MLAWSRFIHLDHSTLRSARSATATLDAVWQKSLGMRPSVLYNIIVIDNQQIVIDNQQIN